jgi:peptidoglycan/xylan/chitin deacetylase (PgdA/CDA1 family)
MDRRLFMTMLAAATATAATACTKASATGPDLASINHAKAVPPPGRPPAPTTPIAAAPAPIARVRLPGGAVLTRLPGAGELLALTVDDGADANVVGAYAAFARDTGIRLTFFVTGGFPGWTEHAAVLRPLVDSGQVQLGNHTWTHPWLTRLSPAGVAEELNRNKAFLRNTFGVDGTPFYRPPYGAHNETVRRVAGDLGYRATTMWYGSLADSGLVKEQFIVHMAKQYFNPQAIVIGHANHPPVTRVYPQLVELIRSRNLRTVTLNDVFTV